VEFYAPWCPFCAVGPGTVSPLPFKSRLFAHSVPLYPYTLAACSTLALHRFPYTTQLNSSLKRLDDAERTDNRPISDFRYITSGAER